MCRACRPESGISAGHRASTRRSTLTVRPSASARSASTARRLGPGTSTGSPSTTTRSGPSTSTRSAAPRPVSAISSHPRRQHARQRDDSARKIHDTAAADPGPYDEEQEPRPRHADRLPRPVRRRPRCDRDHRRRRHRRPARPLPRPRRRRRDPGTVRRADRMPPALPHRVAARAGRRRVRHLRPRDGRVLTHPRAGLLSRRPERPRPARGVPHRARLPARRTAHHRGVPDRRGSRLARARRRRLRRVRRVLPARLRHRAGAELDPRTGGRRREADGRGAGRRRRLRPRVVVGAARPGLPAEHGRRPRLPRAVDRAGPEEGRGGGRRGPGHVRGGHRADPRGHRLRPGDHLRLPARHGRPARRRPPDPRGAGSGRHLAGGRAERRGHRRGHPQPGGQAVLQRLAVPLPAQRAVPGGRLRPRRAGRRGRGPGDRRRGGLHPVPARGGDAVQPGVRDPAD